MLQQKHKKCPLCGTTRTRIEWGKFSPQDYFIQVRYSPGGKIRGTGKGYRGSAKMVPFKIAPEESLRLSDIDENSEYYDEVKKLSAGVRKTLKLVEDHGF